MSIVTPHAIVAGANEIRENPSARSAKLRAAQITGEVQKI